jgi:hypothetical protein
VAQALISNEFFTQHKHRHLSRRRWRASSQPEVDYYKRLVLQKDLEIKKHRRRISEVTKKETVNVANILQLQAENFFRKMEMQSLRNSVAELLAARDNASQALRLFECELHELGRGAEDSEPAVLEYELSEQDWHDIIER